MIEPISWHDDTVVMIDQRALPQEERYLSFASHLDVAAAIKNMTIRGAPAIGIAAAMGIALGLMESPEESSEGLSTIFHDLCNRFAQTRPTAVNLFWAIERMRRCFENHCGNSDAKSIKAILKAEAIRIWKEDIDSNRQIGRHGKDLIRDGSTILTHCNAGALATGGYGTALGVIRAARSQHKAIHVLVDETRPVLQGARLTAWEMNKEEIPATLITDNMAGFFMKQGKVDLVIVGADRIAANGDTANKIGTYSLAVLAHEHNIPFYVAAPCSTIDPNTAAGNAIPIEERDETEVLCCGGTRTAPVGINARNPAFDVTPHRYISAIITERGVLKEPFTEAIKQLADFDRADGVSP